MIVKRNSALKESIRYRILTKCREAVRELGWLAIERHGNIAMGVAPGKDDDAVELRLDSERFTHKESLAGDFKLSLDPNLERRQIKLNGSREEQILYDEGFPVGATLTLLRRLEVGTIISAAVHKLRRTTDARNSTSADGEIVMVPVNDENCSMELRVDLLAPDEYRRLSAIGDDHIIPYGAGGLHLKARAVRQRHAALGFNYAA